MGDYGVEKNTLLGKAGAAVGGLKQLISEDSGQWSATRSWGFIVVGLIVDDVAIRGRPLSWIHIAALGIVASAKVLQKLFEKPAQGVINTKALEHMMDTVAKKVLEGPNPGE